MKDTIPSTHGTTHNGETLYYFNKKFILTYLIPTVANYGSACNR